MIKECEICGTKFETNFGKQKYCKDCSKHVRKNRTRIEQGLWHIESISRDEASKKATMDAKCSECGKVFKTMPSCLIGWGDSCDSQYLFCSNKCRVNFIKFHGTCYNCGKKFNGKYYEISKGIGHGLYCSPECIETKKQERIDKKKKALIKSQCLNCGKEFFRRQKQKYCSSECYHDAIRNGIEKLPTKNSKRSVTIVTVRGKCSVCKKKTEIQCSIDKVGIDPIICSNECRNKYEKRKNVKK